jgi:amino acid transporter
MNLLRSTIMQERVLGVARKTDLMKEESKANQLRRDITWKDAFWLSSGTPLVTFLVMGGVAAVSGKVSWMVFIASILIGFSQCFTYAEIAQIFPNKSGGASVYGAMAWLRYNQIIAPLSVWCNWFAWSPALAVVSGLAGTYIVNLFPADSWVHTWQITLLDLGFIMEGLTLRISMTWVFAVSSILVIFSIQHFGVARAARIQKYFSFTALLVVFGIALAPIVSGRISSENLFPLIPPNGTWNLDGWALILTAMFFAGYTTYAFESSVCYVSEFKDPKNDVFKAILSSGLICLAAYFIQPFAFQGFMGEKVLDPAIMDGSGIAAAMAAMVGGGRVVFYVAYFCFLFVVTISLMTAMAGSSRTIYQASRDGWFPKYLSYVNEHGAPSAAMWTDLGFNIILMMLSNYLFILLASNVCYMIFIFLNLHSGWIHRIDNGHIARPFKAPRIIIGLNTLLSYLNISFVAFAAHVVGKGPILSGFFWSMLIVPVYLYRHYVTDKGVFPSHMYDDLKLAPDVQLKTNAGYLPNLALVAAVVVFFVSYFIAGHADLPK